jgi:hypothetical protein
MDDVKGLPLESPNVAPLEFVNLRGNPKIKDISGFANVASLKWFEVDNNPELKPFELTGVRVVDDSSGSLSFSPNGSFQSFEEETAFGNTLTTGDSEPIAVGKLEEISGTFTIEKFLPSSFEVFFTWPLPDGTDCAVVTLSRDGNPLWYWTAEFSGKECTGFEFAKDKNELTATLTARGGSKIRPMPASITLNQSAAPTEHILSDFAFDSPNRSAGWFNLGAKIDIPHQKEASRIKVTVSSSSNKPLCLDAVCLVPVNHGWTMKLDQGVICFRREDAAPKAFPATSMPSHVVP